MKHYGWTKQGACEVIQTDGTRVQVHFPGKKRAEWVSKTHLLPTPRKVLVCRQADFDQDCGMKAMAAVLGHKVEAFNLYGKLSKFLAEGAKAQGSDESPYARRKFLKEHGFSRACGQKTTCKNAAQKVFEYQKRGYKVVELPSPRKRAVKATPAPETAPAVVTA